MRDEEALPHLLKANPHKSTYANMLLYVRYQVEEFAWKKWGSPEALDAEYERRLSEKKKKKNKKFEESLRELRRKTKESIWQRKKDEEHRHSFGPSEKSENSVSLQTCHTCGFTLEFEELWGYRFVFVLRLCETNSSDSRPARRPDTRVRLLIFYG